MSDTETTTDAFTGANTAGSDTDTNTEVSSSGPFSNSSGPDASDIHDWSDLGREMWSYLTGRGAAVNYSFIDMTVEVPRDIGPDAPRATWKLNGTLRVTTSDDEAVGSDPHRNS